eukprot:CAMPEP_0119332312 /NCGR_PEP_ID=MMETSP1333-20130426/82462_1 /TAXON_ID=418940 /ORGANISM="Scyphosphaera apsteinii, Strain RCC1455" /LENGTH=73 /DNA_ID=CAMNT_0007342109 /DNA_START=417 /DNA_END=635 /DNA_ORIENTATION=+
MALIIALTSATSPAPIAIGAVREHNQVRAESMSSSIACLAARTELGVPRNVTVAEPSGFFCKSMTACVSSRKL